MSTKTVTIYDVELEVEFSYTDYEPAKVDGPPEDCYPEYGGEIEINSITIDQWDVYPLLSDVVVETITAEIQEGLADYIKEEQELAEQDAAEYRADSLRGV